MRIIADKTVKDFYLRHPDAETPLKTWRMLVKRAEWQSMADVLGTFSKARPISDERIIFNIKKNNYRLVARMVFKRKTLWVVFIGTHEEYDKIDPYTVWYY
ncbi:MAG: type II toxin-antitoxin system HigB family toxin [Bacteroidota bacterium]